MQRISSTVTLARAGAASLAVLLLAGCDARRQDDTESGATSASASTVEASAADVASGPLVTVYKNPNCRCCAEWADHLATNGFRVDIREVADVTPTRAARGVPSDLASCHTAIVDGYVIEGHVPADVIRKLLAERPSVAGLAVPGMPDGVPGMPDPVGKRDPYEILAFERNESRSVYATR